MELKNEKNLKRIACYGRVSTNSNDQKNSLEHQKSCYDREYKDNPNYIYNEQYLYFDRGITGTKLNRPEFDKMLYDAGLDIVEVHNNDNDNRRRYLDYVTIPSSSRKPCFDLIIVRNISRFARNINVVKILEQLRQNNVFVYFCDIDKTTERVTDIEEIQTHLLNAEKESRMKSRMVKFGTREGALAGVIRTNKKLYGYKYIGNEVNTEIRLEVIEEEAEVVRKIFQWYLEGYGIRRICKLLTKNKLYTRKGKEFANNTIRGILTNEKYKGWSVRNKYDNGTVFDRKSYAQIRDKSEWIIIKDTEKIPAIIKEEDFDKVQEMFNSKKEHILNKGKYNGTSEFAGKIVCGKCGSVYYANKDGDRRFYNCSNKKKLGIDKCNNKNLSLKQIDIRISPENYRRDIYEANVYYIRQLSVLAYKLIDKIDFKDEKKINKIEKELEELKKRKKKIEYMFENEHIDENEYEKKITGIEQQIKDKILQFTELKKNNDDIKKDLEEIGLTTATLRLEIENTMTLSDEEFRKKYTREYIAKDIVNMFVCEDETINIYYHTYEKYSKLMEKYKGILNFYTNNDIDEFIEKMKFRINETNNKVSQQLKEASI